MYEVLPVARLPESVPLLASYSGILCNSGFLNNFVSCEISRNFCVIKFSDISFSFMRLEFCLGLHLFYPTLHCLFDICLCHVFGNHLASWVVILF